MILLAYSLSLPPTWNRYLSISEAVTCPAPAVSDKTCSRCRNGYFQGLQDLNVVSINSATYLVAYNPTDKEIVIAFRGSDDWIDYITDVFFAQAPLGKPWSGSAKAHAGFQLMYGWIEASVFDNLSRLNELHPNSKIVLLGHSLGGAFAHLSAMYAVKEYGYDAKRIAVYTTGQPRVGNADLVKLSRSCKFEFSRLVNELDLIPHLPPARFGYAHDGKAYQINKDGSLSTRISKGRLFASQGVAHEMYLGWNFGPCSN